MRLSSQDRRVLFTSTLPGHQMQKFLFKQKNYSATEAELREVFSDLSRASFLSMIYGLKGKGIISIKDDMVVLNVDKADLEERNVDIVWRDIRMLKEFTVADIVKDTGLSQEAVREVLRVFMHQNLIKLLTEKKGAVKRRYQLISTSITRPVQQKPLTGEISGAVFEAVKVMPQPFQRTQLNAYLKENQINASSRYVKELLKQWLDVGCLEEATVRTSPKQRISYRYVEGSIRPGVKA